MKRYIFTAVAAAVSSLTVSAQEYPDTLLSVENTSKIVITENPAGVEVKVLNDDGDSSTVSVVAVEYESKDSWTSVGSNKNPLSSIFSKGRRQRKLNRNIKTQSKYIVFTDDPSKVDFKELDIPADSSEIILVDDDLDAMECWTTINTADKKFIMMPHGEDAYSRPRHRKKNMKSSYTDFYAGGFMFGFVNACEAPRGLDIEMGKSFELGIFQLVGVKTSFFRGWSAISVGMGLDWRNYKLTTSSTRFIPVDRQVTFGPYPEDVQARFSRLKVFSLTFPIMWEQRFPFKVPGGDRFSLSFGISLNYNGHASLKSKWIDSSFNEVEEYCGHIGRRPFTFDYVGMVRLSDWLGVYAKYSPKTVLRGSINPAFKSFSTGLILFY